MGKIIAATSKIPKKNNSNLGKETKEKIIAASPKNQHSNSNPSNFEKINVRKIISATLENIYEENIYEENNYSLFEKKNKRSLRARCRAR